MSSTIAAPAPAHFLIIGPNFLTAMLPEAEKKERREASRKERRRLKSVARRARVSKERSEATSNQPSASFLAKMEGRRKRLLARSEKLKTKAQKFLDESAKAREQYEKLVEAEKVRHPPPAMPDDEWKREYPC